MFLNLTMLAGLGGALVPLVLHFLARARSRDVEWGAMMFLDGMDPGQTHHARMRLWTLLGLRMLIVGLLAIAMARPVLRSRWAGLDLQNRVSAVILLDCSYSMALEEAGRTRFDKAREAALQVLSSLRRGDEVTLLTMGDPAGDAAPGSPSGDLQAAARAIADLQVLPGAADAARGLERAREVLDQPTFNQREIYVISDRQAVTWAALAGNSGIEFRKWLTADDATTTRVYLVPVGGDDVENLAIESVELVDSVAVAGQATEAEIRLRNYSPRPQALIELSLWDVGGDDAIRPSGELGSRLKDASVTVGGEASAIIRVPVAFDRVGSHVLRVQVKSPGLELDDTFNRAIDVIDPIRVLLVSGDERGAMVAARESFFLTLALAPYATTGQQPARDPYRVMVVTPEEFSKTNLSGFDVIVLANVPQFTADQARAIEQRVYEGAGLIVCPGNLARVENYNAMLYRDGQGLLPARLEAPLPPDGSRSTTLLGMDLAHPVFRFRRGADPLPGAVVARYFPAVARPADARTLATFASGDPFLVEGPRGRGSVMLVTTPLDADWNTLPLYPFYLPFVQSLVRHAYTSSIPPRNLAVGEPIVMTLGDGGGSDRQRQLVDESRVELTHNGERVSAGGFVTQNQLRYAGTQRPGIYRAAVRSRDGKRVERVAHYVVQVPINESDLRVLAPEQLERVERAFNLERLDVAHAQPLVSKLRTDRGGRELWLPLLLAVLALGAGEIWLSRRWTGGET